MKTIFLKFGFIFLCLIFIECSITKKKYNNATIIFSDNLKIIEKYTKDGKTNNQEDLDMAVKVIEYITNIDSDIVDGQELFYIPSKQNLKDWKRWYRKNKHKLYWDEKEKKVKLRE